MPSNHTGTYLGWLAATYPGLLGMLFSPTFQRGPWSFLPYAMDNGAFICFRHGVAFDQRIPIKTKPGKEPRTASALDAWRDMLEWGRKSAQRPMWCLVPDVVADREGTLRAWDTYAPEAAAYGWPLAFAAQDGMTFADVPKEASVVFIGGSDEFKAAALYPWCDHFPRVHVGRVGSYEHLCRCEDAGAESCDGTGFFMGGDERAEGLLLWLDKAHHKKPGDPQTSLLSVNSSEWTDA